jgi:hypothetical protein
MDHMGGMMDHRGGMMDHKDGMMGYEDEMLDHEGGVEEEKAGGSDTESDNSLTAIQGMVDSVAREQGGTENAAIDASEKGNDDGFDLDQSEHVNCDPQAFSWQDRRRTDSADYEESRWA